MESTVIQPGTGQAILSTSDHDHGHHGNRGHDRNDWERAILREQAAGFREAATARAEAIRDSKDTRGDINAALVRGFDAAALASCKLGDAVAQSSKEAAVASKDQLVTAYQIEGRSQVQAEKLAAAATLQAEKLAAAAALQAEKIASAAQLAAEKCCCELKEKITAEGVATRALIESQEKDRLRDALAKCESQNAAYFARNTPPVVP